MDNATGIKALLLRLQKLDSEGHPLGGSITVKIKSYTMTNTKETNDT